jgi:hypothetical protein
MFMLLYLPLVHRYACGEGQQLMLCCKAILVPSPLPFSVISGFMGKLKEMGIRAVVYRMIRCVMNDEFGNEVQGSPF